MTGIDPDTVVGALIEAGWSTVSHTPGRGRRMTMDGSLYGSLMIFIPLDTSAPDFDHLMQAALRQLRRWAYDGARAQQVLDQLTDENAQRLLAELDQQS